MTTLPDTGKRTEFNTGAVRDAMEGKGLPSEIPPMVIRRLAQHYEAGSHKYSLGNWRKGIPLARYVDGAMRHVMRAAEGLTDEDHEAAALWNIAGFMWTLDQIKKGKLPQELNNLPYYEPENPFDAKDRTVYEKVNAIIEAEEQSRQEREVSGRIPEVGYYVPPRKDPAIKRALLDKEAARIKAATLPYADCTMATNEEAVRLLKDEKARIDRIIDDLNKKGVSVHYVG